MIELKAELMKKRREYEESKKNPSLKPVKKPTTVPTRSRSNIAQITEEDLKKSREALESKSRLYEKLEKGIVMENELNASQRENLMVDFAWKGWNPETEDFEFNFSDSDMEEGSRDVDKNPNTNNINESNSIIGVDQVFQMLNSETDRWIEYEDEFGRIRVSKLSQLRKIQKEREEVNRLRSITLHYDGDAEIRNKGVGFYQFAGDEEERHNQMRELKKLREETVEKRMRTLLMKEERRLRIESRLSKLKERKSSAVTKEE